MSVNNVGGELDLYTKYPVIRRDAPKSSVGSVDKKVEDVWTTIFSFVDGEDLVRCARLSKFHQMVCKDDPDFWKKCAYQSSEKGLIYNVSPGVDESILGWKEVCSHLKLSQFISTLEEHPFDNLDEFIERENPEYDPAADRRTTIHRSIAVSGETTCSIFESFHIKMRNRNTQTASIIRCRVGDGLQLTHLYADRNYIYALRADGTILKCDKKQGRISQTIDTAYSRGATQLRAPSISHFLVQNGMIVLKYGAEKDSLIEVIRSSNPNDRIKISDPDLPHPNSMVIHENKLFILGKSRLYVWDLQQSRKIWVKDIKVEGNDYLAHLAVSKNIVCIAGAYSSLACGPVIHVIDLNRKKIVETFEHSYYRIARFVHMEMTGDLLIARAYLKDRNFDPDEDRSYREEPAIVYLDLRTGLYLGDSPLEFHNPEGSLKPGSVSRLILATDESRVRLENERKKKEKESGCSIQ